MKGRLAVWTISVPLRKVMPLMSASFGPGFGLFGKFEKGFLAFAAYDYVDGFVVCEDFFVAEGCVWSAHDDGGFWADFFGDLADFECGFDGWRHGACADQVLAGTPAILP